MKKIIIFLLIIVALYIPCVSASEKYSDGWHIVVKNDESQREVSWDQQEKEWAYYENGIEIMRYANMVGAHRGWGTAPENSLAAIRDTMKNGYYEFETDVYFTKDNVPVLCHDAYLYIVARNNDLSTISTQVLIKDKTLSELKNNYVFNVESLNHNGVPTVLEEYNTNRITTFEEMLDYVKDNRMFVNVELKDGTREQIESLVKMTQEKDMHNNVKWISFHTDLLKYVRDYSEDEMIGVIQSVYCDSEHDLYCGRETDYYLNKLQTDKNMVFISNNPMKLPVSDFAVNMPAMKNAYSQTVDARLPIPQGIIKLHDDLVSLDVGNGVRVAYDYNGDGTVKCETSDPTKLICSVDESDKSIILTSIGNSTFYGTVKVYATQGVTHSASDDVSFKVKVDTKENIVLKYLQSISLDKYNIKFVNNTFSYKVKQ